MIRILKNRIGPFQLLFTELSWVGLFAFLVALLLGLIFVWLPLSLSATIIAGALVVLLVIIKPFFGIALALVAGPFGALEQLVFGISSLDTGQIILILTFISWLGRGMIRKRIGLPRIRLILPLLLFILTGIVSLLGATSVFSGLLEMLKWLEIALIMILVVDLGQENALNMNKKQKQSIIGESSIIFWLVGMLLLAGLSQAMIGIWQFALRGDGPEHFLVLDRYYRAYGTFEQPNPFGGFMNLTVLLALGILVGLLVTWWQCWRRSSKTENYRFCLTSSWRIFWATMLFLLITAITGLGLLFSWSRGAWFGFAAGLMAMMLFLPRKRAHGILLVGAVISLVIIAFGAGLMPDAIKSRLTSFTQDLTVGDVRGVDISDENYSVLERQAHWQAGLEMFRDDILLGVGFGNFAESYEEFALLNWPDALGHAHNYYVNLLAEVGLLGLVSYIIFWAVVIWQTIYLLGVLPWPNRGTVLGLLSVWIAFAAHHLVDKLYVNNIYIHLGVLFGLLQLLVWYADKVQDEKRFA